MGDLTDEEVLCWVWGQLGIKGRMLEMKFPKNAGNTVDNTYQSRFKLNLVTRIASLF